MHRRDAIKAGTAVLASLGVAGKVEAIDSEPEPLLIVFKCERELSPAEEACICEAMQEIGNYLQKPVVLLRPGMSIEAIVDPRAKH